MTLIHAKVICQIRWIPWKVVTIEEKLHYLPVASGFHMSFSKKFFVKLEEMNKKNLNKSGVWAQDILITLNYRSGTVNLNTVNSKFHLIRSFFEIFARFLSFHV